MPALTFIPFRFRNGSDLTNMQEQGGLWDGEVTFVNGKFEVKEEEEEQEEYASIRRLQPTIHQLGNTLGDWTAKNPIPQR